MSTLVGTTIGIRPGGFKSRFLVKELHMTKRKSKHQRFQTRWSNIWTTAHLSYRVCLKKRCVAPFSTHTVIFALHPRVWELSYAIKSYIMNSFHSLYLDGNLTSKCEKPGFPPCRIMSLSDDETQKELRTDI